MSRQDPLPGIHLFLLPTGREWPSSVESAKLMAERFVSLTPINPENLEVIPFEKRFDSVNFDCGNVHINSYFKNLKNDPAYAAGTYILKHVNTEEIIGFFTLCPDAVLEKETLESTGETTMIYNGPAIRIHMFAINKRYQHQKVISVSDELLSYGAYLLSLCILQIQNLAAECIAVLYITLLSTKEGQPLYEKYGDFISLAEEDEGFVTAQTRDDSDGIAMYRTLNPLP